MLNILQGNNPTNLTLNHQKNAYVSKIQKNQTTKPFKKRTKRADFNGHIFAELQQIVGTRQNKT